MCDCFAIHSIWPFFIFTFIFIHCWRRLSGPQPSVSSSPWSPSSSKPWTHRYHDHLTTKDSAHGMVYPECSCFVLSTDLTIDVGDPHALYSTVLLLCAERTFDAGSHSRIPFPHAWMVHIFRKTPPVTPSPAGTVTSLLKIEVST